MQETSRTFRKTEKAKQKPNEKELSLHFAIACLKKTEWFANKQNKKPTIDLRHIYQFTFLFFHNYEVDLSLCNYPFDFLSSAIQKRKKKRNFSKKREVQKFSQQPFFDLKDSNLIKFGS